MDHRELIDSMVSFYIEFREEHGNEDNRTFTQWAETTGGDGRNLLTKIDLLDLEPHIPVDRDTLAYRVDALQTALNVWVESSSKLSERVTQLERHAQRTGMGEL